MLKSASAASALPARVFDGVIDVSHHNGAIDWPAVADAGIMLAFIKATQGVGFVDPAFEHNRIGAATAGVLALPYHFLDLADAERQAAHFLSVTDLAPGEPAMIDWEGAAPLAALLAFGRRIADRIRRDPVAYYGFAQLRQASDVLSGWPLILPQYPRGSTPGHYRTLVAHPPRLPPGRPGTWDDGQRPYDFHQYTPAGRVAGIATSVDRSIWVGTAAELQTWYATGSLPPTPWEDPDSFADLTRPT
jgi:GH25 family lysozyme M1 (1,4-beta-N-acetylmuramidase)